MTIIFFLLLFLILSVVIVDFILWQAWKTKPINSKPLEGGLPFISIFLAVRNEVHTVNQTLNSLEALNYPDDKYEVLMGDDGSDDGSSKILKAWDKETNNFFYVSIEPNQDDLDAKANVLAQLADRARGKYYMVTDADAQVPETWIVKHLSCLKEGVGIQSGFSLVKPDSFFSSMQMLDWGLALGMVKIISGWDIPVTAVGNNMIFSKEAYEKVGGYRSIPFSLTEDFALFREIVKKGFNFQQLANEESMVRTNAISGFWNLLNQRKRWMRGAMELPPFMKTLLVIQALYFPCMLIMIFINPLVAIPLFGLKITIQSLFISKILDRLNQYMPLGHLFIFEIYNGVLSIALMIYYLLPLPVKWKGRKYAKE